MDRYPAPTPAQDGESRHLPLPRGVADVENGVGWIANLSGGIDGISLRDGTRVTSTDLATYPLGVTDYGLLAAAFTLEAPNVMRIVLFDTSFPLPSVSETIPIEFPSWVSLPNATPDDFRYSVRFGDTGVLLEWQAHGRYRGGAPPSKQVVEKHREDARGAVEIDLRSGSVTNRPSAALVASDDLERAMELGCAPYRVGGRWSTQPWRVHGSIARLVAESSDQGEIMWLALSGATPNGERRVELLRGGSLSAMRSSDGLYVFVHDETPDPAAGSAWQVFSAGHGQAVANLDYEVGTEAVDVVGDRVYYLVQGKGAESGTITLKARNLASNRLIWEYELGATQKMVPPKLPP